MNAPFQSSRTWRFTAVATWLVIGLYVVAKAHFVEPAPNVFRMQLWALVFAAATVCFGVLQTEPFSVAHTSLRIPLTFAIGLGVVTLAGLVPNHGSGFLLVLLASELAATLRLRHALGSMAICCLAFAAVPPIARGNNPLILELWWLQALLFGALSLLAVLLVDTLRREAHMRFELLAAREALLHQSRMNERVRLAQELHDVLGHRFAALSLNLETARIQLEGSNHPAEKAVEKALALSHGALRDTRDVVSSLRSDTPLDLRQSLERLKAWVHEPAVHVTMADALAEPPASTTHALLRCIQECITNALRHARASNVWIELQSENNGIRARVRDDGQGASAFQEGNGLQGMRERLAPIGGNMTLTHGPPGFEVSVWLPL